MYCFTQLLMADIDKRDNKQGWAAVQRPDKGPSSVWKRRARYPPQ